MEIPGVVHLAHGPVANRSSHGAKGHLSGTFGPFGRAVQATGPLSTVTLNGIASGWSRDIRTTPQLVTPTTYSPELLSHQPGQLSRTHGKDRSDDCSQRQAQASQGHQLR